MSASSLWNDLGIGPAPDGCSYEQFIAAFDMVRKQKHIDWCLAYLHEIQGNAIDPMLTVAARQYFQQEIEWVMGELEDA